MPTPKTFPIPQRLKPLRAAFDQQPSLADDLVSLLDWSPAEVSELLRGEIEPEPQDMWIIRGLLEHLQRTANASAPALVAA